MRAVSSERSVCWRSRRAADSGRCAAREPRGSGTAATKKESGARVCSPRAAVFARRAETARRTVRGLGLRRFLAGRTPEDVPVQERGDTLEASWREARHADLERVALLHRDLLAQCPKRVVEAVALDDASLANVGL